MKSALLAISSLIGLTLLALLFKILPESPRKCLDLIDELKTHAYWANPVYESVLADNDTFVLSVGEKTYAFMPQSIHNPTYVCETPDNRIWHVALLPTSKLFQLKK